MKLTEMAIRRPLAVTMAVCAAILLGLIAHSRLGVDLLPNVQYPYVSVSIGYPGATPLDVETYITKPVENAVAGLANVDHVISRSVEGGSFVTIQFHDGTNPDLAAVDVERAVDSIRATLPSGAQAPTVQKFDVTAQPVMLVVLSGNRPQDQLYTFADKALKPRLEGIDSVASVTISGGLEREIVVDVDPTKLAAEHVTLGQVVQALQQGNQNVPVGALDTSGRRIDVRVVGEASKSSQLAHIAVAHFGSATVHVGDVATVRDTFKRQTLIAQADGHPAVALAVYKQSTANTVSVADNIRQVLKEIQPELPAGVHVGTLFDSSVSTRNALNDVNQNLIAAIIITGIVLLLFLHTFRSTVIVLLAIPTSLISTYAVMFALGFTLNLLSLMALALLIGILIDDSIVVLENIFRHLQAGEAPRQAALNGRTEIGLAAIAITFVDVVVYTPVAYMSGQIGAFFRQFGLTIATATLFSLIVSFTLTPMLASRWLQLRTPTGSRWERFSEAFDGRLRWLADYYSQIVEWAVLRRRRRLSVIGLSVLLLILSIALVPLHIVGTEFVPNADQGLFTVTVELPVSSSVQQTAVMLNRIDQLVLKLPETDETLAIAGSSDDASAGDQSRYGTIYVQLKPQSQRHRSDRQLAALVQSEAQEIPGIRVRAVAPNFASGSLQPIQYRIQGSDVSTLAQLGDQIAGIVASVPGTASVKNSGVTNLPQLDITVNQARLSDLQLTTGEIAATVTTALNGTVATEYHPPGASQVDVKVRVSGESLSNPAALGNLLMTVPDGQQVPIADVATITPTVGPSQINRYDRLHVVTVSADLAEGNLGTVSSEIQKKLDLLKLPPGYKFVAAGSISDQNSAFSSLLQALALSVVLMYMLLVALYESFFTPFVIMFSLPVALVGALVALAITRDTLNALSMIGLIMLMGLVAKNAILLVDYTNSLRTRGVERVAAIRTAGQTRLRPILMTTSAMVLAMLPLALKIGPGAELRASMGVVLIGGLISSLLLTLVLVPVMYVTTEDITRRLGRFGRWLMRPRSRRGHRAGGEDEYPLPPAKTPEPALRISSRDVTPEV
ncbi:MAG: efflux RND transporter permease subunit [Chloroflexi bacterium]|nr:efflux RND transporter permease subunit [Chloroflexota bacterium]